MNERQLIIIVAIIIGSLMALAIIIGALIIKKSLIKEIQNSREILIEKIQDNFDKKADSYLKSLGDSLGKSLGDSLGEFAKQKGEKDLAKYKRVINMIKNRPEVRIMIPPLAKLLDELEN